jgi:Protein of unknown function (DUF1592)/Protein of unknown function (DUF1588)/Protein of unknown function (DUF1595)
MRYARRFLVSTRLRAGVLPLCATLLLSCHGEVGGTGGSVGTDTTPLCDAADPTNVVSPQRIALVTSTQLMNMIRLVSTTGSVGNDVVSMITDNSKFPVLSDRDVRFPPLRNETIHLILDTDKLAPFDNTAAFLGQYVRDNFATVTGCATPAQDSCATSYLNTLAKKAYRRALTTDEQTRFSNLYTKLKSDLVNGYQVTTTVEQATGFAVNAIFMSPQVLWKWELGGAASTTPAGVYLTDTELASHLSFFLTDQAPDDMLMNAAMSGSLRANIGSHVDRLLATQPSRDWMTKVVGLYFFLNQLPYAPVPAVADKPDTYAIAGPGLYADLQASSKAYLNDVMWNGKVMDLVTSHKAFVNTNLSTMLYGLPAAPAGASPTNFVSVDLDPAQRAGILTDPGFITTRARSTGVGVIPRGLGVKALFTCLETPGPPDSIAAQVKAAGDKIATQTAQEQVAYRAMTVPCNSCHPSFDPYGLVLDWYDAIGRFRTMDDLGKPIDGHTTLPATIGGATVQSAVELADVLSKSDTFTNCMATTMLKYALLDATVELPLPLAQQKGCAAAGIAHAMRTSAKQSFSDLIKATAMSPAFAIRQQIQ